MASRRGRAASREPTRMGVEDARPVHEASPSACAGCDAGAASRAFRTATPVLPMSCRLSGARSRLIAASSRLASDWLAQRNRASSCRADSPACSAPRCLRHAGQGRGTSRAARVSHLAPAAVPYQCCRARSRGGTWPTGFPSAHSKAGRAVPAPPGASSLSLAPQQFIGRCPGERACASPASHGSPANVRHAGCRRQPRRERRDNSLIIQMKDATPSQVVMLGVSAIARGARACASRRGRHAMHARRGFRETSLPLIPFSLLCPDGKLREAGDRVMGLTPGMLLTTGQSASGKVTILLALAEAMAAQGRAVALLTDQPDQFEPFRPLPASWREVCVQPNRTAWQHALQSESSTDALLVVAPLNRENASATMAFACDRWVFAALDTLAAGLDASYALREMGVPYDAFADHVRCVWSQFLVEAHATPALPTRRCPRKISSSCSTTSRPPGPVRRKSAAPRARGAAPRTRRDFRRHLRHRRRAVGDHGRARSGLTIALGPRPSHCRARAGPGTGGTRHHRHQDLPRRIRQSAAPDAERAGPREGGIGEAEQHGRRVRRVDLARPRSAQGGCGSHGRGVLVVEEDRRIRFASARARQALRAEGELSIVDDHVVARTPRMRRSLNEALARAAGAGIRVVRSQAVVSLRDTACACAGEPATSAAANSSGGGGSHPDPKSDTDCWLTCRWFNVCHPYQPKGGGTLRICVPALVCGWYCRGDRQ